MGTNRIKTNLYSRIGVTMTDPTPQKLINVLRNKVDGKPIHVHVPVQVGDLLCCLALLESWNQQNQAMKQLMGENSPGSAMVY